MSIKTYTPLPWTWWTSNSNYRLTGADGKDGGVISAYRATDGLSVLSVHPDDAAFIEIACNSHPKLVEAAKAAEAVFAGQKWRDTSNDPEAVALRLLREALAAAGVA